ARRPRRLRRLRAAAPRGARGRRGRLRVGARRRAAGGGRRARARPDAEARGGGRRAARVARAADPERQGGARAPRRHAAGRAAAAAPRGVTLICLDPGHGTAPAVAAQVEPIGPRSPTTKIEDGGGAPGEAAVALAIARRTRAELERRGYRVVLTRTGPGYRGGNIARARFCNARHAALML